MCALGTPVWAGEPEAALQEEVENALPTVQAPHEEEEEPILSKSEATKARLLAEQVAELGRQADMFARIRDFKTAEDYYLQILTLDIKDSVRRQTMLQMAKLYETSNEPAKEAAVLEKFAETFPEDPGMPQVYIRVGVLYRKLGLSSLALMRFYSVLNYSLKIDSDKIDAYRQLSVRAQMEIADTHYSTKRYEEALKFYSRLRMLDLSPEDRAHAVFQTAQCHYMLKQDPEAIANFESFLATYPNDANLAEAMFDLSDAYMRVGRLPDASRIVLDLLKRESKNAKDNEKQWIYWQKKAGMQLGANLFEQKEYASALSLYQAMLTLERSPAWCWPLYYQMGMCYEKLAAQDKAAESYKKILDWKENERAEAQKVDTLKSLYDLAKWRIDNMTWAKETSSQLENLLDKSRS